MKIYWFLLLIVFVFSCQSQTASKNVVSKIERAAINNNLLPSQEKINDDEDVLRKSILRCGDKDFNLIVVYKNGRKNVNIQQGNATIRTINLPSQNEVNGFSLNWAKETKEGFEISIEYGSRYYYEKRFNFACKQGKFYLEEIKINTFDKNDPENSGKKYRTAIKPVLPLEKFSINDYVVN